jgi:MFS family permease
LVRSTSLSRAGDRAPALPAIQRHYGASPTSAVWLLTGFLIAAAVATPLAGRLGDQYGRRRVLLGSLAAFAVASLVCALGGSIGTLIVGRVIQGLGAGVAPLALALARDHVEPESVPTVVELLVAAASIGAIVGLLIRSSDEWPAGSPRRRSGSTAPACRP